MYRNTVYSEDNIVYLDEYKKSSLHEKRQQEQLCKKHEKKKRPCRKNEKLIKPRDYKINFTAFIVAITLLGFICFGIAYCMNSGSKILKTETAQSISMARY